jgi:SNF2 family DNA or RNA helicase
MQEPESVTPESAKKHLGNDYDVVIIDEALRIKNPKAQRTAAIKELCREVPVVIAMTGTPMSAGRELDTLGILNTANADCVPVGPHAIWNFGVNPRLEKISERFGVQREGKTLVQDGFDRDKISAFAAPYIHVIPQSEIAAELPAISYQRINLDRPSGWSLFIKGLQTERNKSKALAQARMSTDGVYLDDDEQPIELTRKAKLDWLQEFVTENPEEQVVVIVNWQASQNLFCDELTVAGQTREEKFGVTAITGSRQGNLQDFLDRKSRVLILSAAMVEGYNLQFNSRIIVFVSNSSSPSMREQAIARVYRPGQTRPVIVVDLLCAGTLDAVTLDLLEAHQGASEAFINAQLAACLEGMK